jgi:hypothetical protein
MRILKNAFVLSLAAAALAGCASRLGYPAKQVGIPTPVTLFSQIPPKAVIRNTMAWGAVEMWNALYQKKFEDILGKISGVNQRAMLNMVFSADVDKAKTLFAPSSLIPQDIGVPYAKTKNDPPNYCGYDFTQYKDSITTPYVLALTIDDYGLIAAQENKDNGPFVQLSMQLINKDTNASLWKYTYVFQMQQDKDASEITNPDKLEHMFNKLITNGTNAFFMWLSM